VIAGSGLVTLRLAQQLQMLGLTMPKDLGMVGFDELEWSSLIGPGITTFSQPTHEIGVAAVRNLLARLGGEKSPPHNTIFPGNLIIRGSSARIGT
jgi:LacI family kdg operon repressor